VGHLAVGTSKRLTVILSGNPSATRHQKCSVICLLITAVFFKKARSKSEVWRPLLKILTLSKLVANLQMCRWATSWH
jgi:hypothetical protein